MSITLETTNDATRPETPASPALWVAASGTALVMAVFSAFVVNVGDSVRAFHAGVAGEAWGLSGMSLGLAAALLTAGALADDLGHRRVLRYSGALLAAASAIGALAPSIEMLVAARVLQGVAGGGILAAGLGSIGRSFPSGPARTRATAVWGAAVGAGVTAGPLAGAGLAAAVGWRSGFWVETAAAAALVPAAATLAETQTAGSVRLDLPGIATFGAGMTLLTAALVETRNGWSAITPLVLFGAAGLMLGAFAAVELRSGHPMLDPHLLAQPRFLVSVSGALFTGLAVVGLMSYAPALMQQSLHINELGSAAVLATWSATSMIVALAAGSLPSRLPAQTRLLIGLSLAGVGELALTGLGTGTSWTRLVPGLFVTGLGTGLVNAALGRLAVESMPHGRGGMASGANNTARYLGGAAGAALVVSIASAGGVHALIAGWNVAALVSAGLCALGVAIVASCRTFGRRTPHNNQSRLTQPGGSHDLATQLPHRPATRRRAQVPHRAGAARQRNASLQPGVFSTMEYQAGAGCASAPGREPRRSGAARQATTPAGVPEMRTMTAPCAGCAVSAAGLESLVLGNGTRISLQQVGAEDRAGMTALFDRLSPQSRYQRFLSPKRELTERELTFFTDVDHFNHEAIAAVDQHDGSIVGVARYVREAVQADVAEVAIEVADAFQRMGIGSALASLTIQRAHANGLTLLTATTLRENRAAHGLLRLHGFRVRQSRAGETRHELDLEELG